VSLAPTLPSFFDLGPVGIHPAVESTKRVFKGSSELGELIKGGRLHAAGIEVARDQAVAFGSAKRVGEHFVRDPVECIIEVLVAPTAIYELSQDRQGPPGTE
jgi:hypothetical protein